MNVFEAVKGNVTARQAAEAYGLKVGRTGMACCPFHSDKSSSMKLDEWHPLFVEALQRKNYIEYLLDLLLLGEPEEKKALVLDQRKEVMKLGRRIAEHTAHERGRSQRKSEPNR